MDSGADLQSQLLFSHSEMPESFDDFLNSCDTPTTSEAAVHAHTCLHTHAQVISAGGEDDDAREESSSRPRRPLGNREAVRKYREKKKAHAAFLEEEVRKLRAANQQLLRRLQGHAALEAEVARLRSLLLDIRGKIDAEVRGGFPFPKQSSVSSVSVVGDDQALCFNGGSESGGAWEESSGPTAAGRGIDDGGGVSREIAISETLHSMNMNVAAGFVTPD